VHNGPDSNLYRLEPNFGCCTANLHQGWPKFASSLWMKAPDGGLQAIPVIARVKGRRLPDWKIAKGAADPPPLSPVTSAAQVEQLTLIPYGWTDLRITEFPTLAPR
jgi:hypothetical protein